MADKMSIDKKDAVKEDSGDESIGSSPENEPGPTNNSTQENQQPKRKGGRKPIYATSEERKQRNRQAQAAFRERRTEYIKQLEETIRVHEQNLHSLQAAHRHAADECLMLRYKNSLLERILLEKGIDVQAELRAKTGSPNLGPTHVPQNLVQPPPIPRAILNRHHNRRSNSSIAPKLEPGVTLPPPLTISHTNPHSSAASPKNRPTPSSHSASPTASGSGFVASPGGSDQIPPTSMRPSMPQPTMKPQQQQGQVNPMAGMVPPGQHRMMPPMQAQMQQHQSSMPHQAARTGGVSAQSYYSTPAFQNHIEQLGKLAQQEYDAAADMMDESAEPPDTPSGPGPYPGAPYGGGEHQQMNLASPATTTPMDGHGQQTQQGGYPSMTQLLDPSLDWDPFGLSASMAFPTQFSFDTSNMR